MRHRSERLNILADAAREAFPPFVPFSVRYAAARAADEIVRDWYCDRNPFPPRMLRLWRKK